jgi:hypothetical protein
VLLCGRECPKASASAGSVTVNCSHVILMLIMDKVVALLSCRAGEAELIRLVLRQ